MRQSYDSDSSKVSWKAVFFLIGNKYSSIPMKKAENFKESYETMKTLMKPMSYEEHNRELCDDPKVVELILGLE